VNNPILTTPPRPDRARLPARQALALKEGVLPEPTLDDTCIVLWLPGARDGAFQLWERVSTLPRGEITARNGLCATAAVSIPARQPLPGLLGKMLRPFRRVAEDRAWLLPNGHSAERHGEKRSDLILVWAEDAAAVPDEARIRAQWPEGREVRQIGENLFLVSGVELPPSPGAAAPLPPQTCPLPAAEQLLAAARQRGDRRAEAQALTDLGILHYQEGDARRAAALLEEAVALGRELGDDSVEKDALGHLGLAAFALGQTARARDLLAASLRHAREARDPYAEKLGLAQFGLACASSGDPSGAIVLFGQALALARQLGDRKHEVELLWYLSIQHAQLGERELAVAHGQATVDLLTKLGKPQAAWYAHHLQQYRQAGAGAAPGTPGQPAPAPPPESFLGGSVIATTGSWGGPPAPPPAGNPGFLRMAFSAAKSMAQFLGSGLKTVTPAVHQRRLQTCAGCEHHTGVRCRLCSCFTNVKARMAHEECPIGRWPA
jgi:tetratricopeptide (TPR) repeat protein